MGLEFGLEVVRDGETVVLLASGELDIQHRDRVANLAIGELEQAKLVVLDLSQVTFIDSSGLSALIRSRQAATRLGREFAIRGATGPVARVLRGHRPRPIPTCDRRLTAAGTGRQPAPADQTAAAPHVHIEGAPC